jgi:hypothetical protein
MTLLTAISPSAEPGPTVDERWAAWVAKGAEHDRRFKGRVRVMVSLLAAGLAIGFAILSIA